MYVRIIRATLPAERLDAALTRYRDRLLPSLRTQPGFLGGMAAYDSEHGESVVAGYWETAAALEASRPMVAAGREEAIQTPGVTIIDVDEYEVLLQDRVAPPRAGTFVRANDLWASPDKIDAALALVRDTAIPEVRARSGYRGSSLVANRATGHMITTTSWETAADRGPSDRHTVLRARVLAAAGASEARVALGEVLFVELSDAVVRSQGSGTAVVG